MFESFSQNFHCYLDFISDSIYILGLFFSGSVKEVIGMLKDCIESVNHFG
jgi:hypothetical protein